MFSSVVHAPNVVSALDHCLSALYRSSFFTLHHIQAYFELALSTPVTSAKKYTMFNHMPLCSRVVKFSTSVQISDSPSFN